MRVRRLTLLILMFVRVRRMWDGTRARFLRDLFMCRVRGILRVRLDVGLGLVGTLSCVVIILFVMGLRRHVGMVVCTLDGLRLMYVGRLL